MAVVIQTTILDINQNNPFLLMIAKCSARWNQSLPQTSEAVVSDNEDNILGAEATSSPYMVVSISDFNTKDIFTKGVGVWHFYCSNF
jgi:hypothetical protein